MKRLTVALLAGALLLGCRRSEMPDPAGGGQGPEVVIRFATKTNPANKVWVAGDLVRRELERRSGGRIKVLFYDSGSLGDERKLLETCYLGVIEMVQCTSSVVTTVDPTFSLLDMPYLFVDEAHHRRVLNGPVGRELLSGLRRHRLQGLAFYSCGFRNMFNTAGRAVRRPEDLKGLKIRVMESPVMLDSINAMGASATPLAATEVFQALKTGVVDGAENNARVFVSERFFETGCRNFSWTRHFANQHVLIVNKAWFDRLGETHPDLQQLVRDVATDIIQRYNGAWEASVAEALSVMRRQNVEMNELDDVGRFIESVRPVYDKFLRQHPEVPPSLLERIRKEAKR